MKKVLNMQRTNLSKQGFTLIELIIVIVVIGILTTIMIVSYSSITQRSSTASAEDAANLVARKIESFKSEKGAYPDTLSVLTTDTSKPYYLNPNAVFTTLGTTQPTVPNTIKFMKCGTTPNTTQAAITSSGNNITGMRIYFWTYTNGGNANSYVSAGNDTGTGVACPTS
jgi:prepilin-type N-terminal cleavage/methylation domain-containing protein